jgi:predicted nucleotidyltransferase
MYQQSNRYKILREFFNKPNKKFQLRELSRLTNISLPSVKKHIEELLKLYLIKEIKDGIYKGYKSSLNNNYRILKRNDFLIRIHESGLIKELEKVCTPNCIVLYGSAVEGLDDERGDIDIFIQSNKKNIELKNYETVLNRRISLLFEQKLNKINKTFINSLANGIVLSGFLKVT